MSIGGKNIGDIQPFAVSVQFGLFQSVIRRQVFGFRFDQCNSHGLRFAADFDTQNVIHAAFGLFEGFAAVNDNGTGSFLTFNEVFRPAAFM